MQKPDFTDSRSVIPAASIFSGTKQRVKHVIYASYNVFDTLVRYGDNQRGRNDTARISKIRCFRVF